MVESLAVIETKLIKLSVKVYQHYAGLILLPLKELVYTESVLQEYRENYRLHPEADQYFNVRGNVEVNLFSSRALAAQYPYDRLRTQDSWLHKVVKKNNEYVSTWWHDEKRELVVLSYGLSLNIHCPTSASYELEKHYWLQCY